MVLLPSARATEMRWLPSLTKIDLAHLVQLDRRQAAKIVGRHVDPLPALAQLLVPGPEGAGEVAVLAGAAHDLVQRHLLQAALAGDVQPQLALHIVEGQQIVGLAAQQRDQAFDHGLALGMVELAVRLGAGGQVFAHRQPAASKGRPSTRRPQPRWPVNSPALADHQPAAEGEAHPAAHAPALIGGVAGDVVQVGGFDGRVGRGVEDHHVGVAAGQQRALARVEAENAGRIGQRSARPAATR